MTKQLRLNLILLGVIVLLSAAAWFGQKKEPPKEPVTALHVDTIHHIVLSHPKAADIVLDKKDGKWALTAPVQVAADTYEVSSLLGIAVAPAKSSFDQKEVKLSDLGLAPPGYSLKLDDVQVDFGSQQPITFQRYIHIGDKVDLIDDPPASALDSDYSDLAAKELLPPGAQIASIAVPGLKVARAADGKWSADPAGPKAGGDELQKFVDAWAGARALWNAATPADAKPAADQQTAVVTLKDGSALSFNIVGRDPQLVLERADLKLRYSLGKNEVERLLKLPQPAPAATTDKKAEAAPPPAAPAPDNKH